MNMSLRKQRNTRMRLTESTCEKTEYDPRYVDLNDLTYRNLLTQFRRSNYNTYLFFYYQEVQLSHLHLHTHVFFT